jgi:hypothetical protein
MIRLWRLTTGEDIIGKVFEEVESNPEKQLQPTSEGYTKIQKPFVLIPMQGKPGQPMQIGFHPYIPYTKDEVIKIKNINIITETTPETHLEDTYEKQTSVILTPKSKIIS